MSYIVDEWGDLVDVPVRSSPRVVQVVIRLRLNPCIEELVRYTSGFKEGVDLNTLSARFFDGFTFCPNGIDAHYMVRRAIAAGVVELRGDTIFVPKVSV